MLVNTDEYDRLLRIKLLVGTVPAIIHHEMDTTYSATVTIIIIVLYVKCQCVEGL